MVGNDDDLVTRCACCLDSGIGAVVDGLDGALDGGIHARVTHHVAVGIVDDDEVVLLCLDGLNEFVLDLVSAHLGLEVVGRHLGTVDQDAVLVLEGFFSAAIEEECDVGIFLGLGDVQLLLAKRRQVLSEGVRHVLLVKEDVQSRECGVVGRHAAVVQVGDSVHSLLGHILLGQHGGELLGAVVAEVEEDDHVARQDASVDGGVDDGFDELVGHALVIALLDGLRHVVALAPYSVNELVVRFLNAFPSLVAIHGVVASGDGGNHAGTLGAVLLELGDKALAALRVSVTAVHEAVDEDFVQLILVGDVAESEEVLQRAVHAAVAGEAHEVYATARLLSAGESSDHLGVLHDGAVGDGAIDFHEVLIDHASGANVQVAHLTVAHLSVGQSDVLSAGHKLGVGVFGTKQVPIGSLGEENRVAAGWRRYAPPVQNHE